MQVNVSSVSLDCARHKLLLSRYQSINGCRPLPYTVLSVQTLISFIKYKTNNRKLTTVK